jgi:hypothetical protein
MRTKMPNSKITFIALIALISLPTLTNAEGSPIPRNSSGDKGKYFALNITRKGSIVKGIHKRVGVDSVDYDLLEVDCRQRRMRHLGYSDVSASAIKIKSTPSKWFDLVPGSSKNDFAKFVCK